MAHSVSQQLWYSLLDTLTVFKTIPLHKWHWNNYFTQMLQFWYRRSRNVVGNTLQASYKYKTYKNVELRTISWSWNDRTSVDLLFPLCSRLIFLMVESDVNHKSTFLPIITKLYIHRKSTNRSAQCAVWLLWVASAQECVQLKSSAECFGKTQPSFAYLRIVWNFSQNRTESLDVTRSTLPRWREGRFSYSHVLR